MPSDKPKDRAIDINYWWYGKRMTDLYVTSDNTIIKDTSDSDNEDNKREGHDDNGEKMDDDQGKRDDKSVRDFDVGVKK